jgi:hypothetical protein
VTKASYREKSYFVKVRCIQLQLSLIHLELSVRRPALVSLIDLHLFLLIDLLGDLLYVHCQ